MTRRRKFKVADVARWDGQPVVIVDWRTDPKGRGEYRIVRTVGITGKAYGPLRWVDSNKLDHYPPSDMRWYRRPHVVRDARANLRLGDDQDRGCTCNCCPHVAIPRTLIREDGTFEGE